MVPSLKPGDIIWGFNLCNLSGYNLIIKKKFQLSRLVPVSYIIYGIKIYNIMCFVSVISKIPAIHDIVYQVPQTLYDTFNVFSISGDLKPCYIYWDKSQNNCNTMTWHYMVQLIRVIDLCPLAVANNFFYNNQKKGELH